jgi:hypothetical protein
MDEKSQFDKGYGRCRASDDFAAPPDPLPQERDWFYDNSLSYVADPSKRSEEDISNMVHEFFELVPHAPDDTPIPLSGPDSAPMIEGPALPYISDAERHRRQRSCEFAQATIELEGFEVSEEDQILARRFINGQVDIEEIIKLAKEPISRVGTSSKR